MYTNFEAKGELVLSHHGTKGQKWGIRRYQNEDGSLTPAGKARYLREAKKLGKLQVKADIGKQKEAVEKYGDRAKIAGKIGLVGAGLAAGSVGGVGAVKKVSRLITDYKLKGLKDWRHQTLEQLKSDKDKTYQQLANTYYNEGLINAYGGKLSQSIVDSYNSHADKAFDEYERGYDKTWKSYRDAESNLEGTHAKVSNTVGKIAKYTTIAGAGAAAISTGFYAYNKIRQHAAKKRLTEVGHSKAVAKARQQANKMKDMFGNVKMKDVLAQNEKKKKSK